MCNHHTSCMMGLVVYVFVKMFECTREHLVHMFVNRDTTLDCLSCGNAFLYVCFHVNSGTYELLVCEIMLRTICLIVNAVLRLAYVNGILELCWIVSYAYLLYGLKVELELVQAVGNAMERVTEYHCHVRCVRRTRVALRLTAVVRPREVLRFMSCNLLCARASRALQTTRSVLCMFTMFGRLCLNLGYQTYQ